MRRVARDVALGDEATEALAEHDRLGDAERIAQPHHVVGEGIERPFGGRAAVAATMPALVDVDDLRNVRQA